MISPPVPDGRLAGYRLVRKLAAGSRADVYLGVGATGSVALKVFAPEVSRDSIGAELEALGRVDSPHLVSLLDVSTSVNDVPILVLERVSQGSVATLLADRDAVECGEAVTLLAPIAALVAELHDGGVAHSRIGATSVHLGAEGQPVLIGLGHCEFFVPGGTMAAIDAEPAAAADRDALAAFTLAVLDRVRPGTRYGHVRELAEWVANAPRAYEFPRQLEERLFACADPLPVSAINERSVRTVVPARVAFATAPEAADSSAATVPQVVTATPARPLPAWAPALLLDNPLETVKRRVLTAVRTVRPRFWIAIGAVAIGLTLAIALIPSTGSGPASQTTPVPQVTHSHRSPALGPLPDDPVRAAGILVGARATCVRDLSILCLDAIDEPSSAAFASDASLIQKIQNGGESSTTDAADAGEPTLIERLGDTALIGIGAADHHTSILVIKTKSGWRIRDYLTGVQATGSP